MSLNESAMTTVNKTIVLLEISGPDSERLLQGQLTCDVVRLDDQHWVTGACCTAKGRMVANFVIARQGTRFLLRLPAAQADGLRQHLSRYAVFYKVSLSISSWQVRGRFDTDTSLAGQAQWQDNQCQLYWADGRCEHWGEQATGIPLDDSRWQYADLDAGVVWVQTKTREQWIPQHLHWDVLGGVNFRKGCYTGQEVVARVQYLGKSKRQLASIELAEPRTVALLTPVVLGDKTIGEIAAWCGRRGLAVLSHDPEDTQVSVDGVSASLGQCSLAALDQPRSH